MKHVTVENLVSVLTFAVMLQHVSWPLELSALLGHAVTLTYASSWEVTRSAEQAEENVTLQKLAQEVQVTVHRMYW